jgi:beta-glucosidase/6-phospho-beta-glucosidase/beta-galactosidase
MPGAFPSILFCNSLGLGSSLSGTFVTYLIHAQVKRWITINDPHSVSYGYSDPQSFAPGVNGAAVGYYLAAQTLIKSHARVYRLYEREFRDSQGGKNRTLSSNTAQEVIKKKVFEGNCLLKVEDKYEIMLYELACVSHVLPYN